MKIRKNLLIRGESLCYDFSKGKNYMKFEMTPMKICVVLILGIVTFGLMLSSIDSAVIDYERQHTISCFPKHSPSAPGELFVSTISQTANEPLVRLFQILFILFIISPPLIVVLLFLIWKELKTGNKLK